MKKKDPVQVIRVGKAALGVSSVGCYTFQVVGSNQLAPPGVLPYYQVSRSMMPVRIGDFNVVPMGETNAYPDELRVIMDEDNFLPKALEKNFGLIWGQGPALFKTKFENGRRIREYLDDKDIQGWLDSWDYLEYLTRATTDFTTVNGHFTKFFRNLGARIGKKAIIAKLEHSGVAFSRLEWPDAYNQVHHIITGDFRQPYKMALQNGNLESFFTLRSYPIFDPSDPFIFPVSMRYSNLYNFALDYEHSHAPFHGAINWIKLASSIPKLLSNFNANSAAIKYHIESPQEYWDAKADELLKKCELENIEYTQKMLEDLKDETFLKITNALAGIEKAGKLVTTESFFSEKSSPQSELTGWKINVLDQKVNDFIQAQLNIARESSFQVSAGSGLPPSLSNLSKDGNLPSGAEKLYDFKVYLMTAIDVPEGIIMKDLNAAIKANFPGTDLRMGFYHDIVMTEAQTTPGDRLKNAGPGGSITQTLEPAKPV